MPNDTGIRGPPANGEVSGTIRKKEGRNGLP